MGALRAAPSSLRGRLAPLLSALLLTAMATSACSGDKTHGAAFEEPPREQRINATAPTSSATAPTASQSAAAPSLAPTDKAEAEMLEALEDGGAPEAEKDEDTIKVGVPYQQAQIFSGPASTRESRIGYARRGAKLAVVDLTPVEGRHCPDGWIKLKPSGYVCSKYVTKNLNDPQVRLGVKEPTVDEILPYKYARNAAHGTPLYRTVPSRDDIAYYEPYLNIKPSRPREEPTRASSAEASAPAKKTSKKAKKKKGKRAKTEQRDEVSSKSEELTAKRTDESKLTGAEATEASSDEQPTKAADEQPAERVANSDVAPAASIALPAPSASADVLASQTAAAVLGDLADAGAPDAAEDEASKPWFMRKYEAGKGPDIKLSDLTEGSDRVMVKRMARGFYLAFDRSFVMNNRTWYKTTEGLLAPADRVTMVKPNPFHGEEISEERAGNNVAFVLSKTASKYQLDDSRKSVKPSGMLKRYDRAFLTGETATVGTRVFRETLDGYWVRDNDVTITEPGPPPLSLKPGEKWVDVNLSRQTVVAFEGTRPVYATITSTGRKGADKAHDHRTPTGSWRVREKHIAAIMDGDGAAAGDLPYSIEDVPYVLYYHESYALHAAFWHDNFGRQQSHGCTNLAPLDAKRIFFWSEPQLPPGWHGMFSTPENPGTLIVVHD